MNEQASYNKIIDGLFLGDHRSSTNIGLLARERISLVVNCSKDLPFQERIHGIERFRVSVHDNLQESEIRAMLPYLSSAADIIHRHISQGNAVLVHCWAGRQRSASVLAAFLIRYGNMNLKSAIEFIRHFRPVAFRPGVNFLKTLKQFEHNEHSRNNMS